jgi:hypothetical protein
MPCIFVNNKTAQLKIENFAQTAFRLSPVSFLASQSKSIETFGSHRCQDTEQNNWTK